MLIWNLIPYRFYGKVGIWYWHRYRFYGKVGIWYWYRRDTDLMVSLVLETHGLRYPMASASVVPKLSQYRLPNAEVKLYICWFGTQYLTMSEISSHSCFSWEMELHVRKEMKKILARSQTRLKYYITSYFSGYRGVAHHILVRPTLKHYLKLVCPPVFLFLYLSLPAM